MPIKPIDIYTMPPKSQEASQLQQGSMTRAATMNQQMNTHYQNETKHNLQKTVKAEQKENKNFRFDAKEKGSNEYKENYKKKKKAKEKEKSVVPKNSGGNFDITI
ncbi:hypothetical protein [Anaeromicropila populeti]|uniref:Uncharacterized protein n=1 Tax=Anaeromicropila populeti TaxID=37658 RepID=A0A1I6KXP0_9FIRM|nr:hypothetical protein [Anaeromicropila populeti]SFR95982.1 hypothetical protein SAMN05661086_02856 [Anaeromicropila populeti]